MSQVQKSEKMSAGDLVVLKGGGPIMTVGDPDDHFGKVMCSWFSGKKLESASFAPQQLRLATDEDK